MSEDLYSAFKIAYLLPQPGTGKIQVVLSQQAGVQHLLSLEHAVFASFLDFPFFPLAACAEKLDMIATAIIPKIIFFILSYLRLKN